MIQEHGGCQRKQPPKKVNNHFMCYILLVHSLPLVQPHTSCLDLLLLGLPFPPLTLWSTFFPSDFIVSLGYVCCVTSDSSFFYLLVSLSCARGQTMSCPCVYWKLQLVVFQHPVLPSFVLLVFLLLPPRISWSAHNLHLLSSCHSQPLC